jgi:hypothetical protein
MIASRRISVGRWPRLLPLCLLLTAPLYCVGQCPLAFNSPTTLSNDPVVGTGSPFLYNNGSGNPNITFVHQGNAPNTVYADFGIVNSPTNLGLRANPQNGLGDVTAAQLPNGNIMYAYEPYLQSSNMYLAQSPAFNEYQFVTGGPAFNYRLTPTLLSYGGAVYTAYTDQSGHVDIARTTNGTQWTYLGSAPGAANAVSRPTLAGYNGNLYVGFVDSSHFAEVGPVVTGGVFSPNVQQITNMQFSNSSNGGSLAGISLVQVNSQLLLVGQGVNGTHSLQEELSSNGSTWPTFGVCSNI